MRRLKLSAGSVLHTARSLRGPGWCVSSDLINVISGLLGWGRFTNINNIFATLMFMRGSLFICSFCQSVAGPGEEEGAGKVTGIIHHSQCTTVQSPLAGGCGWWGVGGDGG